MYLRLFLVAGNLVNDGEGPGRENLEGMRRLRSLGSFSLEKRRLRAHPFVA